MKFNSQDYNTDRYDGMTVVKVKEFEGSRVDKWLFSLFYDFVIVLSGGTELNCRKTQIEG